jgi:hypothetical protein
MRSISSRERAYAEIVARDIHPDLFEGVPESDDVKDLRKRFDYADQLEDLRRVWLDDRFGLGYSPLSSSISCTVHNYDGQFSGTGYIDAKASRELLMRRARALRSMGCTIRKEYHDNYYYIKGEFPSGLVVTLMVDRAAVCEKKVVGQEWIEPMKGHYRDVVEWTCEPISILKETR